ncbi:MAG: ABC transporter substrate-binding protein [Promethearchaeota archaeon]
MKKQLILKLLLVLFTLLIPSSFFLTSNRDTANKDSLQSSQSTSLIYGTISSPMQWDPHYAYDRGSKDVIDQVTEHLYEFDISDPDFPIIPWLASAMPTISPDGLNYVIPLRTDITFHDGTPFDATAVQWNFYRLMWFINWTGNAWLPAPWNTPVPIGILTTQLRNLYMTAIGEPIIQDIIVESVYQIRFVLRERKASFLSLLCSFGSWMLSPESVIIQGKQFDYLRYEDNDVLIGTGPFKYQDYITDTQVNFIDNPDYWQGAPHITDLTFLIFDDLTDLSSALLTGSVDLIDRLELSFIPQFEADPDIEVVSAGNTLGCGWITFDYEIMSLAMRRALSWCFDYTYMIDVIFEGAALRWPTYLPNGIQYASYYLDYPKFDVSKARDFLLNDAYYGPICAARGLTAGSSDSEWINVANTNPIANWNITWNIESQIRGDIANALSYNAEYIGVYIDVVGLSFSELLDRILYQRHMLEMYIMGWLPDYPDPENYINPLYSDISVINGGNFYEPDVQQLMDDGLIESDSVAREAIYREIQRLMVEEYLPAITLYTPMNHDAWRGDIHGWISNPHERLYFYPVYVVSEDLTPPAWNPEDDLIPSEIDIYYTRSPQIIGSIKIYDSSPISNVQLVNVDPPYNGQPDEGFSLSVTHYPQDSNNLYWADVVIQTTNLLSRGEHHLKLIFYDAQGNTAEKSFNVTVYRQLQLTLTGEFDYLEAEPIRISITAYLVDVETGNPIIPTVDLPLTVKIVLLNSEGVNLGTFEMEHIALGVYRFVLDWTIEQLQYILTKGIYLIYGYVDFNVVNHFYSVKEDVIQFHIDPPSGTEPSLWPIFMVGSFGGLTILYVTLTFLLLKKRRRNLELK